MAYIIDISLLAILVFSALRGYKRGIIKSAIKFVLLLLAVFFAKILTGIIAPALAEALPMPGIGTKLASYLNINLSKLGEISLADLLTQWGFPEKAANSIQDFFQSSAESANKSISGQLSPAVDRLFTQLIVFVFLFLLFWLVAMLLSMLINNALDLPVLKQVDRLSGLAFGLLCGLLAVFVITLIAAWGLPLLDASFDMNLTGIIVSKSLLIRFFNTCNPFLGLLG
jgi:uncharacterized membrane protein required for colicin V production